MIPLQIIATVIVMIYMILSQVQHTIKSDGLFVITHTVNICHTSIYVSVHYSYIHIRQLLFLL